MAGNTQEAENTQCVVTQFPKQEGLPTPSQFSVMRSSRTASGEGLKYEIDAENANKRQTMFSLEAVPESALKILKSWFRVLTHRTSYRS